MAYIPSCLICLVNMPRARKWCSMNIQIFGTKKCFDTKKAERYFKERRVKFQFVDISRYGLSKGEFESVVKAVGLEALIRKPSDEYFQYNLDKIHTPENRKTVVYENQKLIVTPVVRNGKEATVGFKPDIWKQWE